MSDPRRGVDAEPVAAAAAAQSNGGEGAAPLDHEVLVLAGVVALGAIMSVLDTTIVNVALATVGRELHTSLSTVQWVSTGYLLAVAMVMPLTGWAVGRFGAKRLWMISVALFIVGSALCGVAWSIGSLIAFRVLQGLGGGMIMPVGQTIMALAAGPQRMGRVMSVMGVPMLLGPVFGPIIGGVLVQDVSWQWIFYINLPIGVAALVLAARVLPRAPTRRTERLDLPGLVLASAGLALLVYGLSAANRSGGFTAPQVYGCILTGAILPVGFVAHSLRRGAAALIDIRLFANRYFSAASGTALLLGFGLFGAMLLLPLYYQIVRGEGALNAGLLLAPQGLGAAMAMPLAGRWSDRIGVRPVVLPGIALALAGTIAFTQVSATTPYALLGGSLFVRGIGLGATLMPTMAAAYASLSREAVPKATTAINIVRQVGGSLGTAVLAVVLARNITHKFPVAGAGHDFTQFGALPPGARTQAAPLLAEAFGQTFLVALALTAALYIPAIFLPKRAPAAMQPGRSCSAWVRVGQVIH